MDLLMTCDGFLGMMQTAANEGEAGEEETKGTWGEGPCARLCTLVHACARVCVSLEYQEWMFEWGGQITSSYSPSGSGCLCSFWAAGEAQRGKTTTFTPTERKTHRPSSGYHVPYGEKCGSRGPSPAPPSGSVKSKRVEGDSWRFLLPTNCF